jgi:hypothetical protein
MGTSVIFQEGTYKCIHTHHSNPGETPAATPGLWELSWQKQEWTPDRIFNVGWLVTWEDVSYCCVKYDNGTIGIPPDNPDFWVVWVPVNDPSTDPQDGS